MMAIFYKHFVCMALFACGRVFLLFFCMIRVDLCGFVVLVSFLVGNCTAPLGTHEDTFHNHVREGRFSDNRQFLPVGPIGRTRKLLYYTSLLRRNKDVAVEYSLSQ